MTGGVLYARKDNDHFVNHAFLRSRGIDESDSALLLGLLRKHAELAGSRTARRLLEEWERERTTFLAYVPLASRPAAALQEAETRHA
jgi:glutamate synthase domain-containing protein 3